MLPESELSESGRTYRRRRAANLCVRCGTPQTGARTGKRHCAACDQQYRIYDKRRSKKPERVAAERHYRQERKDKLYARLGGYICVCCGETEPMFLTIEHKNGGGRQERRRLSSRNYYSYLLKKQDLSGYEILCMNCNRGKWLNGGICPHKSQHDGRK